MHSKDKSSISPARNLKRTQCWEQLSTFIGRLNTLAPFKGQPSAHEQTNDSSEILTSDSQTTLGSQLTYGITGLLELSSTFFRNFISSSKVTCTNTTEPRPRRPTATPPTPAQASLFSSLKQATKPNQQTAQASQSELSGRSQPQSRHSTRFQCTKISPLSPPPALSLTSLAAKRPTPRSNAACLS